MSADEPKRIKNNPSIQELTELLPALKFMVAMADISGVFGVNSSELKDLGEKASDILKQADILEIPDRFNTAFANSGWVTTSSMSLDMMRNALELHAAGETIKAEQAIIEWFSEANITLFAVTRSKYFSENSGRWDQLNEALKLTVEERYLAAVPLILIACDGFASDILGTSPFEKDADLSVFDSIAGHPTSLPFLIKLLTKGIRKSSNEELTLPLRHGILHGRSLGYANKLVCMKAWMLMIALVDWANDKRSETSRKAERERKNNFSIKEFVDSSRKHQADKEALEAFVPRVVTAPFSTPLEPSLPEATIIAFLSAWQNKNFGAMAKLAIKSAGEPINKLAGEMRRDVEQVALISFELQSLTQNSTMGARAVVAMQGETISGEVGGMFAIRAFRYTVEGDLAMPTDEGDWVVAQGCIFDLMYERKIDASQNEAK